MQDEDCAQDALPLSVPQLSIWNMERYHGGAIANIAVSVFFREELTAEQLSSALNKTIAAHEALRMRIILEDGEPRQCAAIFEEHQFELIAFATSRDFDEWAQVKATEAMDLQRDLFEAVMVSCEGERGVFFRAHHLVADAWSIKVIVSTLLCALDGREISPTYYSEYLEVEKSYRSSQRFEKDKTHFLEQFKYIDELVYLKEIHGRDTLAKRKTKVQCLDGTHRIKSFCAQNQISEFALLMNALGIYLYRTRGAKKAFFGTTTLNRSGREEKRTAGMFANTVPVLVQIDEKKTSFENLLNNSIAITGLLRHQKYQYSDMLQDVRAEYGSVDRLFDVLLNYQNVNIERERVSANWHFCGQQGASLVINVSDRGSSGTLTFEYDYQTALFSEDEVEGLHGHLMNLLFDLIESPEKYPQDLGLLSSAEYNKVICAFNDTAADYPGDKCIHQLFEEQAERTPDRVAIVFENKEITYDELNSAANSLARVLQSKGVARGDLVAIVARRSHVIHIAQMAILKAGGAYLPVDPAYPIERIEFMLNDAQCKMSLVLGVSVHGEVIDLQEWDHISKGDTSLPKYNTNLSNCNTPEDPCYCIYTSGSTGRPKGVVVSHRNASNYSALTPKGPLRYFQTQDIHNVVAIAAIGFDIFGTESFAALVNGRTIILASEDETHSQELLARLITRSGGEFLQATPSKLKSLMFDKANLGFLENLKAIALGGEPLDGLLISEVSTHTKAKIFNSYGPSEATICSAMFECSEGDFAIGSPVTNTQIFILDEHQQPLPIGIKGELCIAGDGVAKGYINRGDLSSRVFVPNPFGRGQLYRTGDLARWRSDGNLEFVGRIDSQVKLRGLRVELGEIESVIEGVIPGYQVVVLIGESRGQQYLCAYYVGEVIDETLVRRALSEKLPRYMIPNFFMNMAAIPLTPNGKTDRRAFPLPHAYDVNSNLRLAAPRTDKEEILCQLMGELLGLPAVGITDDFFELGGDSLKAIEFAARANARGIEFSLQDVFNNSTVEMLATESSRQMRADLPFPLGDTVSIEELSGIAPDVHSTPRMTSLGDVFLTGVTGFLGAHILGDLVKQTDGNVYCLVRADSQKLGEERLQGALGYYFGDEVIGPGRVKVIVGDLTKEIILPDSIDTVIHCAADVRHFGHFGSSYQTNVFGTKNVLKATKRVGAKLLHISTTSVSGKGFRFSAEFPQTDFSEHDFYVKQPLDNVYVRTKIEAECEVLSAVNSGLNASIARVGNLSNRFSDLLFQPNFNENAILAKFAAFIEMGKYPEGFAEMEIEYSPVDDVSKALVALLQHYTCVPSVFHVYNPKTIPVVQFFELMSEKGFQVAPCGEGHFASLLTDKLQKSTGDGTLRAFGGDIGGERDVSQHDPIVLKNDLTQHRLDSLNFEWSEIGAGYLNDYISYFSNKGLWRVDA